MPSPTKDSRGRPASGKRRAARSPAASSGPGRPAARSRSQPPAPDPEKLRTAGAPKGRRAAGPRAKPSAPAGTPTRSPAGERAGRAGAPAVPWTRRVGAPSTAPRLLAIARRDRPEVYQALQASLEGEKLAQESLISVIWDRRQGPRRTDSRAVASDRRQSDRRAELPPTWATLGFLLAPAPPAPAADKTPVPCSGLTARGRCGLPAEPSRKLRMRPGSAERHYECPAGHRFHRLTGQSGVLPCDCGGPRTLESKTGDAPSPPRPR
jgi:hypothetical protein